MDDEDNDYEAERQKQIAANQELLNSLGLDQDGTAKISFPKPKAAAKPAPSKKRKSDASHHKADEGPRRRSGRIAGLEADGEAIKIKLEQEEQEREEIRIQSRKAREQVMPLKTMLEDAEDEEIKALETLLADVAKLDNGREEPREPSGVEELKAAFKNMSLKANVKVTQERIFSMIVHPEKTKTLVLAGDKQGVMGIWDADAEEEERVWRVQAHARSSITCMKVDPVNGAGVFSSSYDCSLRHLDFATLTSTEVFAFADEDMLVTHFDLLPTGQEAWIADRNGGISHCDMRDRGERRRWIVQGEGRAVKLGGLSVNPMHPHLLVTAGNDQHLRIWDTRQLNNMSPRAAEILTPPPTATAHIKKEEMDVDVKPRIDTSPQYETPWSAIEKHMQGKGKDLLRASYQHGKSCSAAYWDPWGKRILTTSYDDRLRVWSINDFDNYSDFKPSKAIPHNCQTGRWLTILRAQWSQHTDYYPHFTVGNMKRSLDVIGMGGEKIASLWTDAVTAVPAVTASHPGRVDHVVGGNTSGRVQLWTSTTDA